MTAFAQNAYAAQALDAGETLIAWRSRIVRTPYLEGVLLADAAVTVRLQCVRAGVTIEATPGAGTVETTAELDETNWITVASENVAADTPWPYSWQVVGREGRLLIDAAAAATINLEVNVRD